MDENHRKMKWTMERITVANFRVGTSDFIVVRVVAFLLRLADHRGLLAVDLRQVGLSLVAPEKHFESIESYFQLNKF